MKCSKCNRSERTIELTTCANLDCGSHTCPECVTELQLELEACSDHCGAKIVADMRASYHRNLARHSRRAADADHRAAVALNHLNNRHLAEKRAA